MDRGWELHLLGIRTYHGKLCGRSIVSGPRQPVQGLGFRDNLGSGSGSPNSSFPLPMVTPLTIGLAWGIYENRCPKPLKLNIGTLIMHTFNSVYKHTQLSEMHSISSMYS